MAGHVIGFLTIALIGCTSVRTQTVVTCSCDLTASACDVNCCCDPDCSTSDVATFVCSSDTLNQDSKLCVNDLVFVNNLPSSSVANDNGVFCIVRQSDTSQNFYTDPTILTTAAEFDATSQQYPTYSYDLSTAATTSTEIFYKTGDTVDVQYTNGLRGKLTLPVPGVANSCIDSNPASFMTDETSSCGRRFVLSSTCTSGSVLDPLSYYSPDFFSVAQLPIINASEAISLVNMTVCDGVAAPALLTWDGTTCFNTVVSVSYRISYNGTTGISAACVSFPEISNISSSSLVQTFSITFVSTSTNLTNATPRSGNPGYVIGKPLRTATGSAVGNLTLDTSVLTLLSPNSNGDGTCTGTGKQQINFGKDSRTGCIFSFTRNTDCSTLCADINTTLNFPTNAFVAIYGNTAVNSTASDWLEVIKPANPCDTVSSGITVSSPNGCGGVVVGINYNVFFANTGSLSNPQPQIIGVQCTAATKTIRYECFGTNCLSNSANQYLEIASSITFTDASSSPATILKERPTVDARLPSDFFFPFTGTST